MRHHCFDFQIAASDIASDVLTQAREGRYVGRSLNALRATHPSEFARYFETDGDGARIVSALRTRVRYFEHNLFERLNACEPFDVIFLRNVLIYFDLPDQQRVVANMRSALADDGYLLLGESESHSRMTTPFEFEVPLIYRAGAALPCDDVNRIPALAGATVIRIGEVKTAGRDVILRATLGSCVGIGAACCGAPDVSTLSRIACWPLRRPAQRPMRGKARFEISAVREIVRVPPMMQAPTLSHPHCIGMLRLREEAVPVPDFAGFVGLRASSASASSGQNSSGSLDADEHRIIVAAVGGGNIGWRVDAIETIISYFVDDVLPIPLLTDTRAAMFSGSITNERADASGSEVILLDHAAIFSHEELDTFARNYRNLHATSAADERAGARQRGRREQYLAFRLDQRFATPLNMVREIIEMPADSTPAPGGPQFVTGILNLRQQMIPLIDLRSLYGIASNTSGHGARPESTQGVDRRTREAPLRPDCRRRRNDCQR
jgi:chemotaxis signal transduction protein/SAM-dependent methyltransferase